MRLVFLGSPEPVVPILKGLLELGPQHGHELVAVVSQAPKPVGRAGHIQDPPVAAWAKSQKIEVLQPEKASDPAFLARLEDLKPDVMVTAAYGQILTEAFLKIPTRGTINVHPSLLPKYRGAIPVQAALLNGEKETGVTILFTVKRLDAGAIIVQRKSAIQPTETAQALLDRMFVLGRDLIFEALDKLKVSTFTGEPQNDADATHCKKLNKEDGKIDWNLSSQEIFNRYRAYFPWPSSYTFLGEKRITIHGMAMPTNISTSSAPANTGSVTWDKPTRSLEVCTSDGCLLISSLQPAGGKVMDASAFWNGLKVKEGLRFFS